MNCGSSKELARLKKEKQQSSVGTFTAHKLYGTMSAKGRAKRPKKQLPNLFEQMLLWTFGERSEPEKQKVFRVSARRIAEIMVQC